MNLTLSEHPRLRAVSVIDVADVAEGVRALRLAAATAFRAGQYVMMSIAGLDARPFSIASPPGTEFLEFHIRDTGHGPGSEALRSIKAGDTVNISDALGDGYLRHDSGRPLLALAGGMGITPLKSILQDHLNRPATPDARLYWGGRALKHLYLDGLFRDLSRHHAHFAYIPVLSEEKAENCRSGFLSEALDSDFPGLEDMDIYLSGPPAMLESTLPFLLKKGAQKDRIFGDGVAR
jgi:ferredoxin-NAD(P)+ reductase (naphthalene dioxygenase ferredoxin-specific)